MVEFNLIKLIKELQNKEVDQELIDGLVMELQRLEVTLHNLQTMIRGHFDAHTRGNVF